MSNSKEVDIVEVPGVVPRAWISMKFGEVQSNKFIQFL